MHNSHFNRLPTNNNIRSLHNPVYEKDKTTQYRNSINQAQKKFIQQYDVIMLILERLKFKHSHSLMNSANFKTITKSQLVLRWPVLILLLASCTTPTRNLTRLELQNSYSNYTAAYQAELVEISNKSISRLKQEYQQRHQKRQSYDILVLSGGGELGAFGAGFLKGWGNVKSGEYARPEFDSVSGISTGALIAPFAFVGSEESYDSIIQLYRNPDEDLVVARSILSFLLGNRAYYNTRKLHQRIRQSITPNLVEKIADGSTQNRSLLIGATNLDYRMMRVWDLARIAINLPEPDNINKITKRLIASSAIPAAFPPVNIDNFLYVDGGASMQVVSGLENRNWLYDGKASDIEFVNSGEPLRIRIWVVINNKLLVEPEVTSPTWTAIATRSLDTLTRASTLQTLQDIETYTQMINLRSEFEVRMHYVAIPQDYEIPETRNLFDAEKMSRLVKLGEQMGADINSWKKRAVRPGAPGLIENE